MNYAIGQLDQRIELQSRARTPDGVGGSTVAWSTYATVWALVRPMTGRERENAQRTEGTADYMVVIRYRSDVVEAHRIKWRDRYLNIRFPKNQGPRTSWLEIEAEKGASA